ncbi:solute carrier family 23 protein [Gluconacetobacter tumulicola]|uniref:Pyrimidine utilization transport protein G n=1 Tax=Gluconacetobacter tumulicola TaxID=1017177 RepID=A0A7W4JFJ4_9PROT|nr:solute carrier family 23 protein [Gluconacetobacter tumulicola]MBB2180154.1 pyrimidine utilization transport protein G [Gluconacetobacter tumulicola]
MNANWLPRWRLATGAEVAPDERLPLGMTLAMGVQHVLAMAGSTIIGPILMGFDPNIAVLCSGLGTLLFFLVTGGRLPSYLGTSFSFIAVVVGLTGYSGHGPNPDVPLAVGGIVAAGALYALIGGIVCLTGTGWIERLMPPVVTGAVGAAIGLNLAPVAARGLAGSTSATLTGIFTFLAVAMIAVHAPSAVRRLSVLCGLLVSCTVYALVANGLGLAPPIDFAAVRAAPWFGWPALVGPRFSPHAMMLIAPVALVLVAENLGHIKAVGAMTGRDYGPLTGRAFIGDGLATMLAGFCGGTGVTTYVENIGVMAISRVYSTLVFAAAALFAIALGFSPFFGALLRAIPEPVMGGLALGVLGLIVSTMVRIWIDHAVDFADPRTLFTVGATLIAGAGNLTLTIGGATLGGIAAATLTAIGVNLVLGRGRAPSSTSSGEQTPCP